MGQLNKIPHIIIETKAYEHQLGIHLATMSDGRFKEVPDTSRVRRLGSVMLDTKTGRIVAVLKLDTLYSEASMAPEVLSRWLSTDPVTHPYQSPYTGFDNNPIFLIDPTGTTASPVYSREGEFLGTDDQGLQGEAIVMNKEDFKQGMSHEEALAKGNEVMKQANAQTPFEAMTDPYTAQAAYDHYKGLKDRPDYDGYLTLDEANKWYREGHGDNLFIDIGKLNLDDISTKDLDSKGRINLFLEDPTSNEGLVYGTVYFKVIDVNTVKAMSNEKFDVYDFDIKHGYDGLNKEHIIISYIRNPETWVGEKYAGKGTPFKISAYGTAKLTK
jgi:hypothetical protein